MSNVTVAPRQHRTYDPRLKLAVIEGDTTAARDAGVPRSTVSDWKRGSPPDVVSAEVIARPWTMTVRWMTSRAVRTRTRHS